MKHKYRNYYFPVLICIFFCLCIFLVRHAFSVRTQTNASLPVTEVKQSFSFLKQGYRNPTGFRRWVKVAKNQKL